jgi:hypothetical protein
MHRDDTSHSTPTRIFRREPRALIIGRTDLRSAHWNFLQDRKGRTK